MADLQTVLAEAVRLNRDISRFLKVSTYPEYDDLSGLDIDFSDGEQLLLLDELWRVAGKLADVQEYVLGAHRLSVPACHGNQPPAEGHCRKIPDSERPLLRLPQQHRSPGDRRIPRRPLLDPDHRGAQRRGLLPCWI